jgi:hypothetical protein
VPGAHDCGPGGQRIPQRIKHVRKRDYLHCSAWVIPKIEPTLFGLARILQDAPATCNIVFKSFATSHACKFSYIFSSKTLTILRTHGTCFRGFRSARLVQRY